MACLIIASNLDCSLLSGSAVLSGKPSGELLLRIVAWLVRLPTAVNPEKKQASSLLLVYALHLNDLGSSMKLKYFDEAVLGDT